MPNRIIGTCKFPDGGTRHRSGLLLQRRTRDRRAVSCAGGVSQRQHVARRGDCCIQQFCLWCHDCNAADAARNPRPQASRAWKPARPTCRCAASGARHASDATHPAVDDGGSKGKGTRPQKLGDFVCDGRKGPARADSPAEERAAPRLRRVGDNVVREGNIGLVRAQHLGEIGM